MPRVNIAGVGPVNFPDSMSPDEISAAIERDILPKARQQAAPQESTAGRLQRRKAEIVAGGGLSGDPGAVKRDPTALERYGAANIAPVVGSIGGLAELGAGAALGAKELVAESLEGKPGLILPGMPGTLSPEAVKRGVAGFVRGSGAAHRVAMRGLRRAKEAAGISPNADLRGQDETMYAMGTLVDPTMVLGKSGKLAKATSSTAPDVAKYVASEIARQKAARTAGAPSAGERLRGFFASVKEDLVDSLAPIEDAVAKAVDAAEVKLRPSADPRNQLDRVLMSKEIASQFIKDAGLDEVVKTVDDVDEFSQFLIARHAPEVEAKGFAAGRDATMDAKTVQTLGPKYDAAANKLSSGFAQFIDKMVEAGLFSKETVAKWRADYPNYVPLNRVFAEIEKASGHEGSKGVASLSAQTIARKQKGSKRVVEDPIEMMFAKIQSGFRQAEQSKAARMLVSLNERLSKRAKAGGPGVENPLEMRQLAPGESAAHSISYFVDGKKQTYATTKEIAEAAKSANREQMGLLTRILSAPVRVFRAGVTGLNVPFIAKNITRDQATAFAVAPRGFAVAATNFDNFARAFWSAVKHDNVYDDLVREGGLFTSFDMARAGSAAPNSTVASIRSTRNAAARASYLVRHPGEMLTAIEDVLSRAEQLTRIQVFSGMREKLVAEGMPVRQATVEAKRAALWTTGSFHRSGRFGRVANAVVPYLNANIQGTRNVIQAFGARPGATTAKVAVSLGLPIAAATVWNMASQKQRDVYEDIADFEKENNIVLVPPEPEADAKGRYKVIKIPLPQGFTTALNPFRRSIEAAMRKDEASAKDLAAQILGTEDDGASRQAVSTLTPQALKVPLELAANFNYFSGRPIVPKSMENLAADRQARPDTSGTARAIGRAVGTSPLNVEHTVRGLTGGLGMQGLHYLDAALASQGALPPEQVGGEGVGQAIQRNFTKAVGGQRARKARAKAKRLQRKGGLK